MSETKEKLWNAQYNRVMITNFALFFSFYLLTPLLPLYLSETYAATKDTIGVVLAGYTIVALLVRPFSGFIVDSFPRKTVLLICLFVYFLFFGGYLLAGSLVWFAIFRTLHGGPFGATTVANSTMAIDVLPPSRRNEGIGLYGLSNNIATAISPSVGLFLYKYCNNFDVLFWISFIVAGLGFLNAAFIKASERELPEKPKKLSFDRFFLVKGWFLGLNLCFFGFCWGVMSNYVAIYSKEILNITTGTGTFFLLLSTGLILSRLQGNKALREGKVISNALSGIIISTVGFFIFVAIPSQISYYCTAILIGVGNGHMWPAFQNMMINMADHNQRGTANSTVLTSWDFGMGIGVLLGGLVSEYLGYNAAFWMIVAAHIAGLLQFILFTRNKYLSTPMPQN